MSNLDKNFIWGGSVTSFQTEGAVNEGGKGLSVYDTKTNEQGLPIWDIAIDFYHRYKEDIALMKELGINFYRFSVCWARIQPDDETLINNEGIDYYNKIIDELIVNGITPMITLNHYDIPLPLQDKYNGFYSRHVVELFQNFACICVQAFGDRVKYWMTFNEQNDYAKECTKASAIIVPDNLTYPQFLYQVNHNIFIAHCSAIKVIREYQPNSKICGMSAVTNFYPNDNTPENSMFCYLADLYTNQFHNYVYTYGHYPKYMEAYFKNHNCFPKFYPGDEEILKNTVDFLGVSYYRSYTLSTGDFNVNKAFYNIIEDHIVRNNNLEITDWGWEIDSVGLRYNLVSLYSRYQLPILILESGISHKETINEYGRIEDNYRIKYHKEHITQMKEAINKDGVDCFGYVVWGPLDMLSSSGDMEKRYGFIFVNRTNSDLKDLKRIRKESFYYMQNVYKTNGKEL